MNAAELPQDLDPHRFFVQWYGADECLIERHRGILCFEDERIRVETEQGVLCVSGHGLSLETLTDTQLKISGQIIVLSIEAKS